MRHAIPFLVLAVLAVLVSVPVSDADASGDRLLIDFGNGDTEWFDAVSGDTYAEILTSAVPGSQTSPAVIRGTGHTEVSGDVTVVCDWHVFSWDGSGWKGLGTDFSIPYAGGCTAFGFYPDGIAPAATPDSPTVWTQMGGDSASRSVSDTFCPESPKLPVEWYRTYTQGYVDSCLVTAGDLLYHTTGGTYGAVGEDADPWVFCLDRFTGDIVWQHHYQVGQGYEVTTPLIVDGFVIVAFTNGDLTVFDRFTGEIVDCINFPFQPPYDGDRIDWDGRTFITGPTTPVYDSGTIYFGLADGRMMAYTISSEGKLSQVWCNTPEAGIRGCIYFHAPTIVSIDGQRLMYQGSYEGYMHCLDASDGHTVWMERIIDIRKDNPDNETPGSVCTATVSPDGTRLLVTCTDGEMIPRYGFTVFLDPLTGKPLTDADGEDTKLFSMMNKPVVTDDGFYTFVKELAYGQGEFVTVDGDTVPAESGVYKFDWDGRVVWKSDYYDNFKGQLLLADGLIFGMDYSAGLAKEFPGGCITAVDAEDGSEVYRLLLRPCTETSYSMTSVLVVDGKLYATNDFGAVYCVSDIAGAGTEEERVETLETVGFHHWSWLALAIVSVAALLIAYRLY